MGTRQSKLRKREGERNEFGTPKNLNTENRNHEFCKGERKPGTGRRGFECGKGGEDGGECTNKREHVKVQEKRRASKSRC